MADTIRGLTDEQLTDYEQRAEQAMLTALESVMGRIAAHLGATRTASALVAAGPESVSPDDLAGITPLWSQAVQDDLLPVVAEVYQDAAGTVHAQLLDAADLPSIPPVTSLASEAYLAQATNTFEEVGADLWETARSELLDGFQQGESIPDLRERLRGSAGLTGRNATLVARTQVLDASNAGSYDTARVSGLDLLKGWEATPDARTRDTHSAAGAFYQGDGMIALADPFTVGGFACERPHDPSLPASERYNCFPAGTLVQAGRIERAYRRWFDGELVDIVTAEGKHLSGTPNHPVLTRRGWVGLGLIAEGDELLCYGVDPDGASRHHIDAVPTEIEKCFDALSVVGELVRVASHRVDFHGERPQGYVDVVRRDGELSDHIRTSVVECLGDLPLPLTDVGLSHLSGGRGQAARCLAAGGTSDGIMGCGSQGQAVLGASSGHSDKHRIATIPGLDTPTEQEPTKSSPLYSGFDSETLLGLAGQIGTDKVIGVRRRPWSGHVYNLQTAGGTYVANDIIVHNCRCTLVYAMAPAVPTPPKDRSAEIEEWHRQRLAQVAAQHEQRLAEAAARHARKLADLDTTDAAETAVQAAQARHAARLAKLTAGYEARRAALAEERARRLGEHAARPGATPEVPDLARVARERQVRIDTARTVAQASIQLDEVAANRLSARALAHRARGAHTSGGVDQATLDELLAAAERLDYDGYRAIADRVGRQAGLTSIGRAGEQTAFDRTRQSSIGVDLPEGTMVTIVRRGYVLDDDGTGKSVVLERAAVQQREPLPSAVPLEPAGVPSAAGPTPVPVRASLMRTRTLSGVQAVFVRERRAALAGYSGASRPHTWPGMARFEGDLDTAREHAEGLLRGVERFPLVPIEVRPTTVPGTFYARTTGGRTVEIAERWSGDRPAYLTSIQQATMPDAGGIRWHPAGTGSPQAIALHEFGHALTDYLSRRIGAGRPLVWSRIRETVRIYAAERGLSDDRLIEREISMYAASNTDELIGEAFADAMVNGDAASPLSRRIMAVLVDEYDQTVGRGPGLAPSVGRVLPSAPRPEPTLATVHLRAGASMESSTWRAERIEGLSGPQTGLLTAITSYVRRPGFVNTRLRTPTPDPDPKAWKTWLHEGSLDELMGRVPFDEVAEQAARKRADRLIAALDRVMDRSRTPMEMTVYRGADIADIGLPGPGKAAGFTWTDAGYVSTSGQRSVAAGSFGSGTGRVTLDIRLPRDTPALRIEGLGEDEVLLGRGLTFRVIEDTRGVGGSGRVVVEVVPGAVEPAAVVEPGLARGVAEALQALTTGRTLDEVRTLLEALPEAKDALKIARRATSTEALTRSLNALATRRGLTLPSAKELKAIQTAERAALVAERKAARAAAAEAARAARAEKARQAAIKRQVKAVEQGEFQHLTLVETHAGGASYTDPAGNRWMVETFTSETDARERALYAALQDLVTRDAADPPLRFTIGRGAPELRGGWQVAYPDLAAPLAGVGPTDWLAVPLARLQALTPAKIKALVAKAGLSPDLAEQLVVQRAAAIVQARILGRRMPSRNAPLLTDVQALARATFAQQAKWIDGVYGTGGLRAKLTDFATIPVSVTRSGVRPVVFEGQILLRGKVVGEFRRDYSYDANGELVAHHASLTIDPKIQGSGFAEQFNANLIDWYRRSGIKQVRLSANIDVGGYAWARAGYEFADQYAADDITARLTAILGDLTAGVRTSRFMSPNVQTAWMQLDPTEVQAQIRAAQALLVRARQHPRFDDPLHPSAYEFSQLGRHTGQGKDDIWIGKATMLGSYWSAVLYL